MDARRLELSSSASVAPGASGDGRTIAGEQIELQEASKREDPLVGQVISERYRVEKLLGSGGMGAVYRAVHVHMRKPVALKVLHQQMTYMPEAVARFEREAVAAGRIAHPNVAAATDFGRLSDGSFYLVLEFVEGRSLRNMLHDAGPLPAKRAVNIARQIAEALAAAHAHDIVHRDLKPENVMLQSNGPHEDFIKVLDFGLAKVNEKGLPEDSTQLTKLGAIFGTPTYMSPEQAAGGAVDYRSDLYALGVVLYEMLAGKPPFESNAIVLLLNKHINEAPPLLPQAVDGRLAGLVMRLLAKSPEARPASAREVVTELVGMRLSLVPPSMQFRTGALLERLPKSVRRGGELALASIQEASRYTARRLGPLLERLWLDALGRFPALSVMGRRIPIARFRPRLGALVALGAGALVIVALLALVTSGDEEAPIAGKATRETAPLAVDEDDTAVAEADTEESALDEDEATRLADIEALPVYKRTVNDWLDLGALQAKSGDYEASTNALRNAIQLDKEQAKNPVLLGVLRRAAEDRKSYEAAITVASTLLGAHGMDLLYDLWMSTRGDRAKRSIHELAYKKLEVLHLRGTSDALRVRLELEFAKRGECEPLRKTLERATRHADERSLEALLALKKTDGCGSNQKADCYACIRDTGDLDLAIGAAKENRAPRFEDGRYVAEP